MGRDTWRHRMHDEEREKSKELNPVWRGVGCVLMVVLSAGGYFLADWFLYQNEINEWFSLPQTLVDIPFLPWLPSGLLIKLAVAIVFLVISYGLINVVYAFLFPIRPGKYDSPPLSPRPRRKR